MPKSKGKRILIVLKCKECKSNLKQNSSEISLKGQSCYYTTKSRQNSPKRIELSKYCKYCRSHTLHVESK